jgi:ring-1,2-phenylacetyl-CoA epoxidase subunit PaaD
VSAVAEFSLKDRILEILSQVPDPEIPCVSVLDLGIVREVRGHTLVITPTYTGCPATVVIERDIRAALDRAGLSNVKIETTLSPPWTTDWISHQGREKLRAYGIAPPPQGAPKHSLRDAHAECPRCGSSHTEEISRFGSTPCKALHRCLDCREPFDRFKCH